MDGLADRATMTGDRRIGCTTTPVRAFAGHVGIQPPGQTGYAATESTSTDSRFAVDQFKGSSHSSHIGHWFPVIWIAPAMISAVKHAASIPKPEFDARQRARRSTWDTPRFLRSYDETVEEDLILPRGLLSLLTTLVESAGSTMRINDCRVTGTDHEFTCATELRPEQAVAVRHLATQDTGVMIA